MSLGLRYTRRSDEPKPVQACTDDKYNHFVTYANTQISKWASAIKGVWYDFCREVIDQDVQFKAFLIEFEVKLIDNENSLKQYEELLKEFNYGPYEVF